MVLSESLLSAVIGREARDIRLGNTVTKRPLKIVFKIEAVPGNWVDVNKFLFDLFNQLKAWATDKDITINSNGNGVAWYNDTYYYADDELGAVIKACEAINKIGSKEA